MKLVSACLLGVACRYDGRDRLDPGIAARFAEGGLYPVCPEVLGGLPIPRRPAEISGGAGAEVLDGRASVRDDTGEDVTEAFVAGALATLSIARAIGADEAILVERSPSCGCGAVYDGSFTGTLVPGDGVAAALLRRRGIRLTRIERRAPKTRVPPKRGE